MCEKATVTARLDELERAQQEHANMGIVRRQNTSVHWSPEW
jgi:hypothetical protein